jgi:hypothetical protein
MICLPNLEFRSGDDLNVEVQTRGLLRLHAKDHHAPRQARVFAVDGLLAVEHLCALRGHAPRRTQGQGFQLSGSVYLDGLRPLALNGDGFMPSSHQESPGCFFTLESEHTVVGVARDNYISPCKFATPMSRP